MLTEWLLELQPSHLSSMKEKNASGKRVFQGDPSNDLHPRHTGIVLEIVVIDRDYFYCYQNVGSASKKRMVIR